MERQKRLGRLSALALLIAVSAVVVFAAYWLAPDLGSRLARDYLGHAADAGVLATQGVIAALVLSTLLLAAALWGIWNAFRLFRVLAETSASPAAGRRVQQMGLAVGAMAVITVLGAPIVSMLLTIERAPGSREFTVSVGLHELVIALTGVVLVAVGYALTDAAAIAEENRQFV